MTLLYHRVNNLVLDHNLLAVSPENFYMQMKFLKQNYHIVRFEDDWNVLDVDCVCITFDDGYLDNFTYALPILQDLDIPATIFISTGNIDTTKEFWWDELERILIKEDYDFPLEFQLKDSIFSCVWPTTTKIERVRLYDTLVWLIKDKISLTKRNNWMEQIRNWSGDNKKTIKNNLNLQMDSIANLNLSLTTIGAHTVNHLTLRGLPENEQYFEIAESKKKLESLFQKEIKVFSYPFGGINDYDNIAKNICKRLKFNKAAANFPGIWQSASDDFEIPRNLVRNWSLDQFRKHIKQFWLLENN